MRLAEADSMRAAAARLGLHHSTVQQQTAALADALGYDPRTPSGRVRFALARSLQRLARPGVLSTRRNVRAQGFSGTQPSSPVSPLCGAPSASASAS